MSWRHPPYPTDEVARAQLEAVCLEHFSGDPASNRSAEGYAAIATGGGTASVNTSAIKPDSDGNALLRIGVSGVPAQAGAIVRQQARSVLANDLSGKWEHVCRVFQDRALDATHVGRMFHGLGDNTANQVEPADGVYFFIDETPASNWLLKQARGGARTVIDTGFGPAVGAWASFKWVLDVDAGTVQAYAANTGSLWLPVGDPVVPANIQPNANVMSCAAASSEGIRNDIVDFAVDYIGWKHVYVTPR